MSMKKAAQPQLSVFKNKPSFGWLITGAVISLVR